MTPTASTSLRTRLILFTAFTMAIVQGAFAFALYFQIRHTLLTQFDAGLHDNASALAAIVDIDHNRLSIDKDALLNSSLADAYFEIHAPPNLALRSANLRDSHLPPASELLGLYDAPLTLPNHLTLRAVALDVSHFEGGDSLTPRISIVVARDDSALRHTLSHIAILLTLLCAAAVLISSLLLAILVRYLLRVTDRLSAQLSSLDAADLSRRIDLPDAPREFQPVITTVNALLHRLAAAFERERSFSTDVAHELRTPLASLQTTLDVSLRRPRDQAAYRTSLLRCDAITRQMRSLVENLLTMARAESGQLGVASHALDPCELLRETWQSFESHAHARALDVLWRCPPGACVETDPEILRLIARNLFDNALSYTPPHGRIEISAHPDESSWTLRVRNSGCRLTHAQAARVFDRFWRADDARTDTESHAGLGLSLCRRLAQALGAKLLATVDQTHFIIELHLPTPPPLTTHYSLLTTDH
ncbi:MAG TPA: ATP-binding protein [Phycisphaerae bacterium]|nr:ATP-binding protein [Phycisphaerae bacterium]